MDCLPAHSRTFLEEASRTEQGTPTAGWGSLGGGAAGAQLGNWVIRGVALQKASCHVFLPVNLGEEERHPWGHNWQVSRLQPERGWGGGGEGDKGAGEDFLLGRNGCYIARSLSIRKTATRPTMAGMWQGMGKVALSPPRGRHQPGETLCEQTPESLVEPSCVLWSPLVDLCGKCRQASSAFLPRFNLSPVLSSSHRSSQ